MTWRRARLWGLKSRFLIFKSCVFGNFHARIKNGAQNQTLGSVNENYFYLFLLYPTWHSCQTECSNILYYFFFPPVFIHLFIFWTIESTWSGFSLFHTEPSDSTRLSGPRLIFSLHWRISSHHYCPLHLPAQFNPLMNAIITQSFTEGLLSLTVKNVGGRKWGDNVPISLSDTMFFHY